jgi:SOS-response transcriptional repressor LexA
VRAALRYTERVALRLIAEAHRDADPPPTIREMAEAAGCVSTNAIAEAVERLIRRGLVAKGPASLSRTLRLSSGTEPHEALRIAAGMEPAPPRRFIPIVRCTSCGADHAEGHCTNKEKQPCESQSLT